MWLDPEVLFCLGFLMMVGGLSVLSLMISLEVMIAGVLLELMMSVLLGGLGSVIFMLALVVLGASVSFVLVSMKSGHISFYSVDKLLLGW